MKTNLINERHKGTSYPKCIESILKERYIPFTEFQMIYPYFKDTFFTVIITNENLWTHLVAMKVHKINSILNYVLGCSHVYNPLRLSLATDAWKHTYYSGATVKEGIVIGLGQSQL